MTQDRASDGAQVPTQAETFIKVPPLSGSLTPNIVQLSEFKLPLVSLVRTETECNKGVKRIKWVRGQKPRAVLKTPEYLSASDEFKLKLTNKYCFAPFCNIGLTIIPISQRKK